MLTKFQVCILYFKNNTDVADDDLDGKAQYLNGDRRDFGSEPYAVDIGRWDCRHDWFRAQPSLHEGSSVAVRP